MDCSVKEEFKTNLVIFKSCECGKRYNRVSSYYYHRKRCKVAENFKTYRDNFERIRSKAVYADKLQREVQFLQENDTDAGKYGDEAFVCDYCGITFSTLHYLTKHDAICRKKSYKIKDREHLCSVCDKCFTTKSNLLAHMRNHQEDRPYTCELCDMKFKTLPSLKSHVSVHMDDSSWECDICNKSFKQRQSLNVHVKVHIEKKAFICRFCGKKLSRRENLKSHIRIHTGEKPYKCENCYESFTHGKQLRLHRPKCLVFVNMCEAILSD